MKPNVTNSKRNIFKVNLQSGEIDRNLPVRLQISMFNPYCTGDYLRAMCEWVKQTGIRTIEFQVSDTLQRHNYIWKKRISKDEARIRSRKDGEDWLSYNKGAIKDCRRFFGNENVVITRWDEWIKHKEFDEIKNYFTELCESDFGFNRSIDNEIRFFFNKTKRSLKGQRKALSVEFLLEEMAVSEISCRYYPANEIYPGPRFIPEVYLQGYDAGKELWLRKMKFIHLEFAGQDHEDKEQKIDAMTKWLADEYSNSLHLGNTA